ncbi:hypothetical protein CHUAL_011228 [Chamberlinius hualienensis]
MFLWTLLLLIAIYLFTTFIVTNSDDNEKLSKHEINSFKVTQLTNILESRKISHFGYMEKKDLVELVFSTDEVENSNEDVWSLQGDHLVYGGSAVDSSPKTEGVILKTKTVVSFIREDILEPATYDHK